MILSKTRFKINQSLATELYRRCNELYFDYRLNFIPVILIDDKKLNGSFKFDLLLEKNNVINPRIEISNYHYRSIEDYTNTMVHEMCHYKTFCDLSRNDIRTAVIAYKNNDLELFNKIFLLDNYAHTDNWLAIVNDINNTYNLNIKLK